MANNIGQCAADATPVVTGAFKKGKVVVMFSTIGKKTRVIFWNLCSMEKFLVAVAVALLFWGPDHSQVPNQDKILPCREAAITVSWGGGGRGGKDQSLVSSNQLALVK